MTFTVRSCSPRVRPEDTLRKLTTCEILLGSEMALLIMLEPAIVVMIAASKPRRRMLGAGQPVRKDIELSGTNRVRVLTHRGISSAGTASRTSRSHSDKMGSTRNSTPTEIRTSSATDTISASL